MRQIKYIVLHCTATPQDTTIESIQNYWKNVLKWKNPGYHYIIDAYGWWFPLLEKEKIANGVAGYNENSIHISYIGGVDANNKPVDNRTPKQIESQILLLEMLKRQFPNAEIKGHRDFPNVKKACPSFDVKKWLNEIKFGTSFIKENSLVNGWAWFNDTKTCFGIVIFTNTVGNRKAFIGNVKGNDNVFEDLKHIVDTGCAFSLSAAEIAVKEKGTTKDINYNDLMP